MSFAQLTAEEVAHALAEAKARGLPDGWDVKLDKRKRRKWIAPSGRTCDSIPKALTMSIEMGLLPQDFVVIHPAKKRRKSTGSTSVGGKRRGRPPKKFRGKHPRSTSLDSSARSALSRRRSTGEAEEEDANDSHDSDDDDSDDDEEGSGDEEPGTSMEGVEEDDEEGSDDNENSDEEDEEMEEPTDPENTLEVGESHLTTVHWDPNCAAGRKIGWKIRVADGDSDWKDGRIIRYDPCTHKHKIQFTDEARVGDMADKDNCVWLHLRVEDGIQIATRLVWAHVKGYAWWPAMVMESDTNQAKEGYVNVEFFGPGETATLRDSPECVRHFENGEVDGFIAKNKKKRNAAAVALAVEEEARILKARNEAARYYAEKAFQMVRDQSKSLLGKRVQIFRTDVNYPYGDTVTGTVRQYSGAQKKWLMSYDMSNKSRKKYEASWINLNSNQHKLRVLDKKSAKEIPDELDLVPYMAGFKFVGEKEGDPAEGTDAHMAELLDTRCRGCVEYFKTSDTKLTCNECNGSFHLSCADPPLTTEAWQRLGKGGFVWVCAKCTPCRGCYQNDIAFGSHRHPLPPTLSFPEGESLDLCSMCVKAYEAGQYCPNCAHSWDDEHFQGVQRQIRWQQAHRPRKRGRKSKREMEDPTSAPDFRSYTAPAMMHGDEVLPLGASVNPTWYHAETAQWGYTEVDMLTCDNCTLWVHAGCAGVSEEEYDQTSSGRHPIYSKEFLCRICCRARCQEIVQKLSDNDAMLLFAEPVSERVAPNYHDVIKNPVDLQTMLQSANREEYHNYAWVREKFELMVLNALTFNLHYTKFWNEAKRYYEVCVTSVFNKIGKAAPPGKYDAAIHENFAKATEAKQMEEDRVQQDSSTEKKDLVAGSKVATVSLPKLREVPPDQASCLPFTEVKIKPVDAYYSAWMDSCYTCGSSGASDTMLFCVDCGESFHSFCVNAPIHSMDSSSVSGWRCPNCKICEISGDAPQDELKMLFCEMCDRAFSLDLLDPPLQSAPPGLWICGQCVECEKCHNTSEPRGVSLTYWSRDPQLCYRCGGCDGLVDQYKKARKCPVCTVVWRDDDTDLAHCADCDSKVHAKCDHRARDFLRKVELASDVQQTQTSQPIKYQCPTCFKKHGSDKNSGKVNRGHFHEHAWKVIEQGAFTPGEDDTTAELHEKLMEQIDWKTRNLWRDEYRKVVSEGVRFLGLAKDQFGGPRELMDKFWHENVDLPTWMGQRATRFIQISSRLKIDTNGFSARKIENCVVIAKLAASWLKVACRTMKCNTRKNVKGYDRVLKLLVPPHECGSLDLPYDSIRCERNRNIINKDEWLEKFEPQLKAAVYESVLKVGNEGHEDGVAVETRLKTAYKLASPLRGWNDHVDSKDTDHKWQDPRECCLCHLCGDDDAGVPVPRGAPETSTDEPNIPRLGRLLPMGEGYWVHASCALWSSETWEAPSGGLVHAVEKARSRGAQLRCFGCGRHGATAGCIKGNCSSNYHFLCAYASDAVFTSKQQMYCVNHKDCAEDTMPLPSIEHMKTLIIAPEKSKPLVDKDPTEAGEASTCWRVGALVVHTLGEIDQNHDGFHNEDYITPPGYMATRIFWSFVTPKSRTVYVLRIERSAHGDKPIFSVTPGDKPSAKIRAPSSAQAYSALIERVRNANVDYFNHGDFFSRLPTARHSRKKTFGLNGPQFFGYALNHIRRALEASPGIEAVVAQLTESSPNYRFCYKQPSADAIVKLQRKRAAAAAERALENSSGCARTEGMQAVTSSGGSGRITRALVRNAETENFGTDAPGKKTDPEKLKADRSLNQRKYREMHSVPIDQRLVAKRSHIHGWGLFSKMDIPKDGMIVEYMGETIRQCVADKREKQYEISGEGSCYMFRLDLQRVIDATVIGCMARFMNHCCQPNAYAKVITVDTDLGPEKKIIVFALRAVGAGEEITYDYKFPVEDGSLKCTCGAPNCIGRMN